MEMTLNLESTTTFSLGNEQDYDVIIIGGGPAGATAAIYTARADLKTLVIDKGLTAGAMGITGIPGVFAVGDVLCNHVKQAVVAAAEGAVAGIAVEKQVHGRKQLAVDWSK